MKRTFEEELGGLQKAYEEAIGTPVDEAKKKNTYRATLEIVLTVDAFSFADSEYKILSAFGQKAGKPTIKVKGLNLEKMTVTGQDELKKPGKT